MVTGSSGGILYPVRAIVSKPPNGHGKKISLGRYLAKLTIFRYPEPRNCPQLWGGDAVWPTRKWF